MDTLNKTQAKVFAVRVIDALGGTAEVARLCKINMAAVSQWKENGIPSYRLDFLRLARPGVFGEIDIHEPILAQTSAKHRRRHDDPKGVE